MRFFELKKKYFSNVLLGNYWYRFYESQCYMLSNVSGDIKMFEPQILIYELNENNNNSNQLMQMQQPQVNPFFVGNLNFYWQIAPYDLLNMKILNIYVFFFMRF